MISGDHFLFVNGISARHTCPCIVLTTESLVSVLLISRSSTLRRVLCSLRTSKFLGPLLEMVYEFIPRWRPAVSSACREVKSFLWWRPVQLEILSSASLFGCWAGVRGHSKGVQIAGPVADCHSCSTFMNAMLWSGWQSLHRPDWWTNAAQRLLGLL